MFTLTELRAALAEAGFEIDDDPDDVRLIFDGDDRPAYFEMGLVIVNDDLIAGIETLGVPLDAAKRSRARRWLDEQGVEEGLRRDEVGDTVVALVVGLEQPRLANVPAWVRETASVAEKLIAGLVEHLDGPDEELAFLKPAVDLYQSGRPAEALTELQRLAGESTGRTARARGLCLGTLGDLQCQLGHIQEGTANLSEAIALLAAAGEQHTAALAEQNLLAADLAAGRYVAGLARCDRVAKALERVGDPGDLDRLETQRGQLLIAMGEYDDAIALLARLERRLSTQPGRSPHLPLARMALGLALQAMGNNDGAATMLEAAQHLFEQANQVLDAGLCLVNRANALVRSERWDEALDVIAHARAIFAPLQLLDHLATLDTCEAFVRRALGDTAEAEALAERAAAELEAGGSSDAVEAAYAQVNLGVMALQNGDSATAIAVSERAARRFEELHLPVELAKVRHNLALARLDAAATALELRPEAAAAILDDALAAVGAIEDARQDFAAVADRGRWAEMTSSIYALAALVNHVFGRHQAVVELLERVRAQGLPDLAATETSAGGLLRSDGAPVGVEAQVADALDVPSPDDDDRALDAVRSALQDLRVASPRPIDIAAVTHAVGGPFAWRWVLWQATGMVIWALVEPAGRVHSGMLPVTGPRRDLTGKPAPWQELMAALDPVGPELEQLGRAQGLGIADGVRKSLAIEEGPLVEDRDDAEPALAWELGRKLVPPVLADELRRRLAPGTDPLPLVIAPSPALARVAFGLLAIEAPAADQPLGRRLLEAAVVTMAPPSGLVEQRAGIRCRSRPPLPVRLAVINPTGDLHHTVRVTDSHPDGATGVEALFEGGADRDRVLAALRALPASGPGVLYWDGHAEPGPDRRPLDARWTLARAANGTPGPGLSVEDLLLEGVHAPSRAVLFGCTTMGVDEGLTEWWGFPVALLYAGATSVVASTWDLFDCPAAAACATEVLRLAIEADDPATALRELQLRWFREWRARRQVDRKFRCDAGDRHPHIWMGWAVVGLHYG